MPSSKTKELARKLGIIGPKRKQTDSNVGTKKRRISQLLSYLVVIDFESTCWENKKGQQEIIEFPAVLLNLDSGEVVNDFQQYVLPMENPTLSDFCKQLTGITQEQVDNGVPIQTCLYLFKQWLNKMQCQTGLLLMEPGREYSQDQHLCSIGTWSDWDLGVCLLYECKRKQIRVPAYFNQWVNIRALYKTFYERRPSGLKGSLEDLGMAFVGQEHSGIDDARNTAKLCYRMVKDGCKLHITKSIASKAFSIIRPPQLQTTAHNSDPPSGSITTVSSGLTNNLSSNFQSDPSPEVFRISHIDHSQNKAIPLPDQLCFSEQPSSQESRVSPLYNVTSVVGLRADEDINGEKVLSPKEKTENAWDNFDDDFLSKALNEVTNVMITQKEILSVPGKNSKQESREECQGPQIRKLQVTTHNNTCHTSKTPNNMIGHVMSPVTPISSVYSSNQILGSLPATSGTQYLTCSTPPLDLTRANTKSRCISFKTPSTSHPANLSSGNSLSSNHTPHSFTLTSRHKVTPPMCECGRRTKRKLVSNCGPNEGKPFFVCPVGSCSSKIRGCGFFMWEGAQKENLFTSGCTSSVYSDM